MGFAVNINIFSCFGTRKVDEDSHVKKSTVKNIVGKLDVAVNTTKKLGYISENARVSIEKLSSASKDAEKVQKEMRGIKSEIVRLKNVVGKENRKGSEGKEKELREALTRATTFGKKLTGYKSEIQDRVNNAKTSEGGAAAYAKQWKIS
jgi:SMC interacting uncharacterized protein involved in chromosome segregation